MLRLLSLLLASLLMAPAFASSLEITVITSKSENRLKAGKSFAGITVESHRSVLRAVELALFESSTLFETLGIDASIPVSYTHLTLPTIYSV